MNRALSKLKAFMFSIQDVLDFIAEGAEQLLYVIREGWQTPARSSGHNYGK